MRARFNNSSLIENSFVSRFLVLRYPFSLGTFEGAEIVEIAFRFAVSGRFSIPFDRSSFLRPFSKLSFQVRISIRARVPRTFALSNLSKQGYLERFRGYTRIFFWKNARRLGERAFHRRGSPLRAYSRLESKFIARRGEKEINLRDALNPLGGILMRQKYERTRVRVLTCARVRKLSKLSSCLLFFSRK